MKSDGSQGLRAEAGGQGAGHIGWTGWGNGWGAPPWVGHLGHVASGLVSWDATSVASAQTGSGVALAH